MISGLVPPFLLAKYLKSKNFLTSLMTGVNQWPEYENMQRTLSETTRIISTIREELATIIWRRVVPGHCKYCPV